MKKALCLFLSMLMMLSVFTVTSLAVDEVKFNEVVCTAEGIALSWTDVKDVANYILYRADGADGADLVVVTTTENKYLDADVALGEAYTYKIVAQANDGSYTDLETADVFTIVFEKKACKHEKTELEVIHPATVYAAGVQQSVCVACKEVVEISEIKQLAPATPAIRSLYNTTKGVAFTWESVDGVDSYNVYRRSAGEVKWELLISTAKTGFTDTTVEDGKYYKYAVRAENGGGLSPYVGGRVIKFVAAPTGLTAANTVGGIYVKWAKAENVDTFRVYRKAVGDANWTYLGSTKNNYYPDLKVEADTDYVYTVRAVSGGYYSNFYSDNKVIKRLDAPKLAECTSTAEGLIVSWEWVDGADGCYIYRKTANSTWTMIGKVRGTKSNAYLDKSTTKGVTYTYTVRAYADSSISSYYVAGITCKDAH